MGEGGRKRSSVSEGERCREWGSEREKVNRKVVEEKKEEKRKRKEKGVKRKGGEKKRQRNG
jgi:hypothetical protein